MITLKNTEHLEIAYILLKYLQDNNQYLTGSLLRVPIYKEILKNYSKEDIDKAFRFVHDNDMLMTSCNENTSIKLIYNMDKDKTQFYTKLFWSEAEPSVRKECSSMLRATYKEELF